MRVLVCGGRDFNDKLYLENKLAEILSSSPTVYVDYLYNGHLDVRGATIIQGGAKGADLVAKEFAMFYGIPCEEYKADWDRYNKRAGPIRNQQMIDEGKPDLVIAFPTEKSKGTYDMIRRAKKHNIKVVVYGWENWGS